jgi:aminoglycoside phosphotransferase family enzyme/predicted kinase
VDLAQLIDGLSRPAAYAHATSVVVVCQTHVSVVFLAGDYAYKIKKPVDFGFLDFTKLEERHRVCLEEVRLNRRLAPAVYLDVVAIVLGPRGLSVGGEGEAVEWAVKMRRLPDQAMLLSALQRGELGDEQLDALAERVASFHRAADRGARIASLGKFDVVAGNARENFAQSAPEVGLTVSASVFEDLRALTESALAELRPLIDDRAARGIPCDGHGDLRLEHIYLFAGEPPPGDIVIIDCLEYTERFRFADPVADIAFTVMELLFAGHSDAARRLADAYFRFTNDDEGRRLLPFYVAYRSVVRGKVRGLELREAEIPADQRAKALERAKAHFLLALVVLAAPRRRPLLALVAGLPGTGKSTLARALGEQAGFEVIRSDVVRKEIAGLGAHERAANTWGSGLYADEWTRRTYEEIRSRAEKALFEGRRVIVDASFGRETLRVDLLESARRLAVPALLFMCDAPGDLVRARLDGRRDDASDADVMVYEAARHAWEPFGPKTRDAVVRVDATDARGACEQAMTALRQRQLM